MLIWNSLARVARADSREVLYCAYYKMSTHFKVIPEQWINMPADEFHKRELNSIKMNENMR